MTMTQAQVAEAQVLLAELDQVNLTVTVLNQMAANKVPTVDITVATAGYVPPPATGASGVSVSYPGTRFTVTVDLPTAQGIVNSRLADIQSRLAALGVA